MEDLLQRYLDMEKSGIGHYFDADEIIDLLDYFEEMDDFEHYDKVLELGQQLHPLNEEIRVYYCKSCVYKRKYEEALTVIEQFGDTGNQELLYLKCECLCALDRYNELIACLETLQREPDDALEDLYVSLVIMLNEQLNNKKACDLVERGMSLFPDNTILKEELCYHLELQGKLEQAVERCKELIDTDPYWTDYWYVLGRLYAIMEKFDLAVEAFDFALASDESDEEIKILKAFCHFRKGDYRKLVEVYADLYLHSPNPNLIFDFIDILIQQSNEFDRAYMMIRKMIERLDESDEKHYLYYDYGETGSARGLLLVADCFPGCLLFFVCQEIALMAKGDREAISNIEQLLRMIYRKATTYANFRMVNDDKFGLLTKQKVKQLLFIRMVKVGFNDDDFSAASKTIDYLLFGDIDRFCREYAQVSPQTITKYLETLFPEGKKPYKRPDSYLSAYEINRDDINGVSSSELSADYLTHKNYQN